MSESETARPALLDVVALLTDQLSDGLVRGQVGTIVETLDGENVLVEFSDDSGRAYAIAPLSRTDLLPLRYTRKAA
jgi:Domain of unknown function (DUF4926)